MEISVCELATERTQKPEVVLVDVREDHVWEICRIDGATLIRLGSLPSRLNELDGHHEIVTYCHHGQRSRQAADFPKGWLLNNES